MSLGERWPLSAHVSTCPHGAYECPRAPITKHPKLGNLADIYSLTALEVQSLKPKCQQGWLLWEFLQQGLSQASLPALGVCW